MRPMTKLRYIELCAGILFLVCVVATVAALYLLTTAIFFGRPWAHFFWAFGVAVAAKWTLRLSRSYRSRTVLEAKLARVFREN